MTLLAGGLISLVTVAFAWGLAVVGGAAAADARAQLAADAAALAAVAEAGPGGSGLPESAARRYAELNGGRVTQCICVPGSHAVQVTVAVEDVSARARAEIDPSLLMPDVSGIAGLQAAMRAAVIQLLEAAKGSVQVISGYRDSQKQAELWSEALATYGDPEVADDWVARPGDSLHQQGLAVDLGGDLALAQRLIAVLELPLVRPLDHEPGHFELRGARS